jgi:hypothetical protein
MNNAQYASPLRLRTSRTKRRFSTFAGRRVSGVDEDELQEEAGTIDFENEPKLVSCVRCCSPVISNSQDEPILRFGFSEKRLVDLEQMRL